MDTTLTIQRIMHVLDKNFANKIDMSDVERDPPEQKRIKFLSRALAAYSVQALTEVDPEIAGKSVTDGSNDNGIDAIYCDVNDKTVYVVQSKWSQGTKTIDQGDMEKFLRGTKLLIGGDLSTFNSKVRSREAEIQNNLLYRSDVRIVLVVIYSSAEPLGSHPQNSLHDFLSQQNNVGDTEVFGLELFDLKRIYDTLSGTGGGKIKLQIALREWGKVSTPYTAFYGQVLVSDIATWAEYGRPLFAKNLRYFSGETEVNESMERTLRDAPEHFWYFNNGITIICASVDKVMLGGGSRDHGIFDCQGVSVINGAQTVGVIWEHSKHGPKKDAPTSVNVRLISLKDCPEGFTTEITRAVNNQNRVQARDFAALDYEQQRLANEMAMDGLRYAFKSGDADPKHNEGCNIEDATVALACSIGDVAITVQAKRNLGQLWQDVTKPPYTTLFNSQLSSVRLWRAVQIMRTAEATLKALDKKDAKRGELVAVHGNRFILHRVFLDPRMSGFDDSKLKAADFVSSATEVTRDVWFRLANLTENFFPDAYLANLFKNTQKCKVIDSEFAKSDSESGGNYELFATPAGRLT